VRGADEAFRASALLEAARAEHAHDLLGARVEAEQIDGAVIDERRDLGGESVEREIAEAAQTARVLHCASEGPDKPHKHQLRPGREPF
jgi:hypothetical protein